MSYIGKDFASATRYIRKLRGGSQPILVQASDGRQYVVKFSNNLQGPNLPFNESIGSELYRAIGLTGPLWKPIQVSDFFLDHNPDCWMQTQQGRLRPASGLCFGSRFVGEHTSRLWEILPGSLFARVRNRESFWLAWMTDICAGHTDNRQALFLEDGNCGLEAFFFDHGHLFGGPKGGQQLHFQGSRYLDPRIYRSVSSNQLLGLKRVATSLNAEQLWRQVRDLPSEWKMPSAIEGFSQCLARLSTRHILDAVLDTIVNSIPRINDNEYNKRHSEREPAHSILRVGVPGARRSERRISNCVSDSACA